MIRLATTMMLAACFAAAQTSPAASNKEDATHQISQAAARIRAAAQDVTQHSARTAEAGTLKARIEEQQLCAAQIQSRLYDIERFEAMAGRYDDDRLDQLKESADRLSDLTAIQTASLDRSSFNVLKRQARSARQWARQVEKDLEKLSD